jgi:hypothetical protein
VLIAVHVIDDSFVQPQLGITAGDHAVGGFPRCQPKRLLLQIVVRSGLWPTIAGGCHPARDTTAATMQAGFDIEEIERFDFSAQRVEPLIPHILGKARRA